VSRIADRSVNARNRIAPIKAQPLLVDPRMSENYGRVMERVRPGASAGNRTRHQPAALARTPAHKQLKQDDIRLEHIRNF
jgi:hypothetical protein